MADTIRTMAYLLQILFPDTLASGAIVPQSMRDALVSLIPPETLLPSAASRPWNLDTDPVSRVVVNATTTITLSGGANGQGYRLAVQQDATGNRTVTLAGCTIIGSPLWQTAANGMNIITVEIINGARFAAIA